MDGKIMFDLIFGGLDHIKELKKLFPKAKIENADDIIHRERVSIDVDIDEEGTEKKKRFFALLSERVSIDVDIDEEEYWRIITLNGFIRMSYHMQLILREMGGAEKKKRFFALLSEWKIKYSGYFKNE